LKLVLISLFSSKGTKVEIYDVISGAIVPRLEVPIMGRISVMKSFRPTVKLKPICFSF